MTTVFISGSRDIPFLPKQAKTRIDRIIDRGFSVVVGDSEKGVDANVIEYLSTCNYSQVTVYTIHEEPRVKSVLDTWDVCRVEPETSKRIGADGSDRNARERETAKDAAMGEIADYGLVIWKSSSPNRFGRESTSKGSLRNMHQLLSQAKPVVLYKYVSDNQPDSGFECLELRTLDDLARVVSGCSDVVKQAYETIVHKSEKEHSAQEALF